MPGRGSRYQEQTTPDDLPAPLTTRNLLPRSRATSISLSAAASRSHSPSSQFSRASPFLPTNQQPIHPPETDVELQLRSFPAISMDHSHGWGTDFNQPVDPITMNHHVGSSSSGFESYNNDASTQPRRSRKKELFAEPMSGGPLAGPSTRPFYNDAQSSAPDSAYRLETTVMQGLKRKRDNSLEPIDPWLNDQHPSNPMSIPIGLLVDNHSSPGPGPSYTTSRDRKGKGKEIDYKGKGKQREANSPILILDSPIISSNIKPLPTTTLHTPSKPLSGPLSSYTCPICFSAPTNATLTPCGHICCGECLFTAVKTVMLRSAQAGAPDSKEARCPVCRALILDWDGKGAGVIGLKASAIFSL